VQARNTQQKTPLPRVLQPSLTGGQIESGFHFTKNLHLLWFLITTLKKTHTILYSHKVKNKNNKKKNGLTGRGVATFAWKGFLRLNRFL